jgi:cytochrome oxidase Cu insertion factor (SCO1/SenC/PrrC family)
MRPHTPPGSESPAALTRAPGRTSMLASSSLAAVLAITAAGPVGCAGKAATPPGAAHRNRMEAPPPFPSAPDFTVADHTGAERSLDALMGRKGLVLVLYRGHW